MNKKLLSFSAVILILSLVIMPFNAVVFAEDGRVSIVILHTNDVHGRIWEEESAAMGYAHMAAKVEEIRKANENVLLLDAGDTFQGSSAASLSRGESIIRIMNGMGYDAMVLGNHDFGFGAQRLFELIDMADFPVLSANTHRQDGSGLFEAFIIKELSGIRLGIFGLTTLETPHKTHPNNVKELIFHNPVERAKEMVATLRDECDFVIALVHLPIMDAVDSCERLAQEVEGIDLIVSGHSHVTLENGIEINGVYIVQTGEYGRNLGIVDVVFENGILVEVRPFLYSPTWTGAALERSTDVQSLIGEIEQEFDEILSQVIGWTDVLLDGERNNVRTRQTNLGALVAEAMRAATGADIAITNGGGIRTSIAPGEITRRDILNVLPFNNYVVLKEMTGWEILQALEHGVSDYPVPSGRFPQVAGVTYSFAPENELGSRITEVRVAGQELDMEKTYIVALNEFIAAGGSGYTILQDGEILGEFGMLDDIVAEYIRNNGISYDSGY